MSTYFVCSDIHSYYDEWMEALDKAGGDYHNPNHVLVVCGDLLDRGSKPLECLEYVLGLPKERRILIRGNHEDLLEDIFVRTFIKGHDIHNGTDRTVDALAGREEDNQLSGQEIIWKAEHNPLIQEYLKELVDYYENDKNIFVHGGIPCSKGDVSGVGLMTEYSPVNGDWHTGDWYNARWINGMAAWQDGVKVEGKTIHCGHWHCNWGGAHIANKCVEWEEDLAFFYDQDVSDIKPIFKPFKKEGICAIDACTAYSGQVNVVKLGKQKKPWNKDDKGQ